MEYKISCKRCRVGIYQHYELIGNGQVMVTTQCLNKNCGWSSTFLIPFSRLLKEEPTIAHRLLKLNVLLVNNN